MPENELTPVVMSMEDVLWECFRHFAHLDEANAAIHCAGVRYSPLTFRLAEQLERVHYAVADTYDLHLLDDVLRHIGQYAEDPGR